MGVLHDCSADLYENTRAYSYVHVAGNTITFLTKNWLEYYYIHVAGIHEELWIISPFHLSIPSTGDEAETLANLCGHTLKSEMSDHYALDF